MKLIACAHCQHEGSPEIVKQLGWTREGKITERFFVRCSDCKVATKVKKGRNEAIRAWQRMNCGV